MCFCFFICPYQMVHENGLDNTIFITRSPFFLVQLWFVYFFIVHLIKIKWAKIKLFFIYNNNKKNGITWKKSIRERKSATSSLRLDKLFTTIKAKHSEKLNFSEILFKANRRSYRERKKKTNTQMKSKFLARRIRLHWCLLT